MVTRLAATELAKQVFGLGVYSPLFWRKDGSWRGGSEMEIGTACNGGVPYLLL